MEKMAQKANFSGLPKHRIQPIQLLTITETWCGDAAPALPFINQLAFHLDWPEPRVIWRDEHPELIDTYNTHGSWCS